LARGLRLDLAAPQGSALLRSQHLLRARKSHLQAVLELLVVPTTLDVTRNRRANDLGHGLPIDAGHGLKQVGLVYGQPDRHGFRRFHGGTMPRRSLGCQTARLRGIMVS
jgi:hypothetical protein